MSKMADIIERLQLLRLKEREALAALVTAVEGTEEHSPRQRDEHYEDDCPICAALTEAVRVLTAGDNAS